MNDSKIKVLLVEPEKYPKEIVIDDSLEAMQEVVGGDIEEYMPYDDDVAIICNEEGVSRWQEERAISLSRGSMTCFQHRSREMRKNFQKSEIFR